MESFNSILEQLPYSEPFLFVDELTSVTEEGVEGQYTFRKDEYFYQGHFKDHPVTPGVILTECMAQIGLVCLGISMFDNKRTEDIQIALSGTQIDFFKPVYPGEQVRVHSEKIYFRFHKLKCNVTMRNASGEVVAKGVISGMMKPLET
ncbi:MAG: beta-hydroxyacyl-ACP dehydratase [Flavobacteriaceae bacterium]|nr:beta-hydroxyacyl-ACP dehydratase [Flavobacteriaceae bacterium]